jgi:hypothetical protein
VTPDELEDTRRHAARLSNQALSDLYVKGPEPWPPEGWRIIEEEVTRRERARKVASLSAGGSDPRESGPITQQQMQIAVRNGIIRASFLIWGAILVGALSGIILGVLVAVLLRPREVGASVGSAVAVFVFAIVSLWALWAWSDVPERSLRDELRE